MWSLEQWSRNSGMRLRISVKNYLILIKNDLILVKNDLILIKNDLILIYLKKVSSSFDKISSSLINCCPVLKQIIKSFKNGGWMQNLLKCRQCCQKVWQHWMPITHLRKNVPIIKWAWSKFSILRCLSEFEKHLITSPKVPSIYPISYIDIIF